MLGMILKLFGGNQAAAIGAAILVAVIAGYVGWLKLDIYNLNNDVAELKLEVRSLELDVEREKANVIECKAQIEGANDRIEDLKESAGHREDILKLLGENIDEVKKVTAAKVGGILDAPTPENCEEAMALLRAGVAQ